MVPCIQKSRTTAINTSRRRSKTASRYLDTFAKKKLLRFAGSERRSQAGRGRQAMSAALRQQNKAGLVERSQPSRVSRFHPRVQRHSRLVRQKGWARSHPCSGWPNPRASANANATRAYANPTRGNAARVRLASDSPNRPSPRAHERLVTAIDKAPAIPIHTIAVNSDVPRVYG
jgi:hypothetical protein